MFNLNIVKFYVFIIFISINGLIFCDDYVAVRKIVNINFEIYIYIRWRNQDAYFSYLLIVLEYNRS